MFIHETIFQRNMLPQRINVCNMPFMDGFNEILLQ